jgi:hypothetical protein
LSRTKSADIASKRLLLDGVDGKVIADSDNGDVGGEASCVKSAAFELR